MYKLNNFLVSPLHAADKKAIPNSFEAFVALAYEGVAEKELLKLARKEEAKKEQAKEKAKEQPKQPSKQSGEEEGDDDDHDNDVVIANKWTHATGGNKRYGGWKTEAFTRLDILRKRIKKSRKQEGGVDGIKAMEKAFLLCLRQRLGLEESTKDAEVRKRRERKRRMKAAAPKEDLKKGAKLLKADDSDEEVNGKIDDAGEEEEGAHTI